MEYRNSDFIIEFYVESDTSYFWNRVIVFQSAQKIDEYLQVVPINPPPSYPPRVVLFGGSYSYTKWNRIIDETIFLLPRIKNVKITISQLVRHLFPLFTSFSDSALNFLWL